MRYRLILLFTIISFSASAQLLSIFKKKQHPVFRHIPQVKDHSLCNVGSGSRVLLTDVKPYAYELGEYSLVAQEKMLIKSAKHNMSWRIYNVASYNFSDLAQLYIKMHRMSEAKWYLLQSNYISRGENDDKHTITNLISLAFIKENGGDLVSARADLIEAHDMAQAKGMKDKVEEIDKKIALLGQNKSSFANRYAETAVAADKDL